MISPAEIDFRNASRFSIGIYTEQRERLVVEPLDEFAPPPGYIASGTGRTNCQRMSAEQPGHGIGST